MKKRKWFLPLGIAAAMLFPQAAMAAGSEDILDYDFRTQQTDVSGTGWEWDAKSQVLSLYGLDLTVPAGIREKDAAIHLPKDSLVYLGEESTIDVQSFGCHAIAAEGDITIRGKDKLIVKTASSKGCVVHTYRGDITLKDGAVIEAYPYGTVFYVDEARGSDGVINIYDTAKVEIYDPNDDNFAGRNMDELVYLIYKSPVKFKDAWVNFDQSYDEQEEAVYFTKKTEKSEPVEKPEEKTEEQEKEQQEKSTHAYAIQIGKTAILKDGEEITHSDRPAYLSQKGYTMLPLRALLSVSMDDVKIDWNQNTKTATVTYGDTTAIIPEHGADSKLVMDGTESIYHFETETIDNRMFVSLRDWCRILQLPQDVLQWDADTKTITMTY